jgi:hypothetical protein
MLENAAKAPSGIGVNPHNHSSQSHAPAGTRHSPLGMPQAAAISSGVGMARQPSQHFGVLVGGTLSSTVWISLPAGIWRSTALRRQRIYRVLCRRPVAERASRALQGGAAARR